VLASVAQQGFELGEDLLDRVEVGRIGRQQQAVRPGRSVAEKQRSLIEDGINPG
jgi:hypothetical protein